MSKMQKPENKCGSIKLFLTDVDGVLTDAGMIYSERGDESKKFCTLDGGGLMLLKAVGIKTGFVTSERTRLVARRAGKLRVDFLLQGVKDKRKAVEELCEKINISPAETAYIGDDINDIPLLRIVGISATVPDHTLPPEQHLDYVTHRKGGDGAVRDFAEWILRQRGEYETALSALLNDASG